MSKGGPEVVDTESEPWGPLQPYLVGDAGPNWARNPGINYNWMDAADQLAGGMPLNRIPPMFMNDPRMTFQDVYTPVEGGPWGYGLGPGELTTEAGIPEQPGDYTRPNFFDYSAGYPMPGGGGGVPDGGTGVPGPGNFVGQPDDFVPGAPVNPGDDFVNRPTEDPGSLALTAELLRRSSKLNQRIGRHERDANEGYGSPYSDSEVMAMMMENPESSNAEIWRLLMGRPI